MKKYLKVTKSCLSKTVGSECDCQNTTLASKKYYFNTPFLIPKSRDWNAANPGIQD